MLFKRVAFVEFFRAMVTASNEPHAEEIRNTIYKKMGTFDAFVEAFARCKSAAAVGAGIFEEQGADVEADDGEQSVIQGVGNAAAKGFDEFRQGLTATGKVCADLLAKIHTGAFSEEFLEIASAHLRFSGFNFSWAELFTGSTESTINGISVPLLRGACRKWIESITLVVGSSASAIGDADRTLRCAVDQGADLEAEQMQKKTIEHLEGLLNSSVVMECVPNCEYTAPGLTKAYKSNDKTQNNAKASTMFLACAELFPCHSLAHGPETFRGVPGNAAPEFKEVIKWLITARQRKDVVLISDGRSDSIRNSIREVLKSVLGDDFTELWLVYDMETSLNTDVRNPKRKNAWSCANVEIIFALLPQMEKGQRKVVARDLFTKCGESTNFSRSYSGVPFRNIAEIPRCTEAQKRDILGMAAVGAFDKQRVMMEVAEQGHPLFWGEWKPVSLFATLCRDFGVTTVVDMTPGSGAASIASLYCKVHYRGFCNNAAHKDWLLGHLRRVFVAIVMNKDVKADDNLVKNVSKYLRRAAEVARQLLPKEPNYKFPASNRPSPDDDSCDDE